MIQSSRRSLLSRAQAAVLGIGAAPEDNEEIRLHKSLLVGMASMIVPAAILWGGLYLYWDEPLAASIPLAYAGASSLSIGVLAATRRYYFFRFSQLLLILLLPFFLMVMLGGFVNGSGVVLWALLSPLGALLFSGRRQAVLWLLAYLVLVVVSAAVEPLLDEETNLPTAVVIVFFGMNISAVSLISIVLLRYFVGQKDMAMRLLHEEQTKSERLLLNVLPGDIAAILKDDDQTIADEFEEVSILFADVVGFTNLSTQLPPQEMVEVLNGVFLHFDSLAEKHGVEKIGTIGDAYFAASGVPSPRGDHAHAIARMALEMASFVVNRPSSAVRALSFRIGINSGPVVAGVIGRTRFHYDLWGDTVNVASRMESHGEPGKIQISRATFELISGDFECQPRGPIEVKGKGLMDTWYLVGARP